jgi:hypothetical protein
MRYRPRKQNIDLRKKYFGSFGALGRVRLTEKAPSDRDARTTWLRT